VTGPPEELDALADEVAPVVDALAVEDAVVEVADDVDADELELVEPPAAVVDPPFEHPRGDATTPRARNTLGATVRRERFMIDPPRGHTALGVGSER